MKHQKNKIGIFVGQAPPESYYEFPFKRTRLFKWFLSVGMEPDFIQDAFVFEALVDKFPGKTPTGHKPPDDSEIQLHIPKILKKIETDSIKFIVPLGKLAIRYVLNEKNIELEKIIGQRIQINAFGKYTKSITIIPLPHPSGLSTWTFQNKNKELLDKALQLIKKELIN